MVSTVDLERCVTGVCILGVIVGKLGYSEEPFPAILLIADEGSEVGFQETVLPFGLAVGLEVEGGTEPSLDFQEETQR